MKSQTEIVEVLGKAFTRKQQEAAFKAITSAIEMGTEEMASMKDLDALNARSDARVERALNRAITAIVSVGGLLIAAMGISVAYLAHHG